MSSYMQWIQKEHQQFIPLPSIPPPSTTPSGESQKPKNGGQEALPLETFPDDEAFMDMIQKDLDALQELDGHGGQSVNRVASGRKEQGASISVSSLSSIHDDASIPSFSGSAAPSFAVSVGSFAAQSTVAPYTTQSSTASYTAHSSTPAFATPSTAPFTSSTAPFTSSTAPFTSSTSPFTPSTAPFTTQEPVFDDSLPMTVSSSTVQFVSHPAQMAPKAAVAADGVGRVENRQFFVTYGDKAVIRDIEGLLHACRFSTGSLLDKNKEVFGHNAFRAGQLEVIRGVLCGYSVVCIMPTGGGKSLCYQLPALMMSGVTIVVSPLVSLVQDQIAALRDAGVEVDAIMGNGLGSDCVGDLWQCVRSNSPPRQKLIYTTPEKLSQSDSMKNLFKCLAQRNYLSLFVIDEVHCMSQWGHDFRPDYKQLGVIRNTFFPNVPLMALTATATDTVKEDILRILGLPPRQVLVFQKSFNRPELHYEVRQKKSQNACLQDICNYIRGHLNETGIIYCATQNLCEKVCKELRERLKDVGYADRVGFYHGGLEDADRVRIQNE